MGRVLVVDDDELQRKFLLDHIAPRHEVKQRASAQAALRSLEKAQVDLLIADLVLPDKDGWWLIEHARAIDRNLSIIVVSGCADLDAAERAMAFRAIGFFRKEWNKKEEVERFQQAVEWGLRLTELQRRAEAAEAGADRHARSQEKLVGCSPQMKAILDQIARCRDSDMAALIEGPTGAGKEVVAKTIHANSPFSGGPFTTANVPLLPRELIASELFGHVKGSFTGADHDRIGLFEQAQNGTLFLDEIGDMELDLQTRIMRAVETKVITRLGSERQIPLRVRIIAATNRPLKAMMRAKTFREDLYYRLNHVHIVVPPLCERRDDIPLLANQFLFKHMRKLGRRLPSRLEDEALAVLCDYPWPGNVRELKAIMERLILGCPDEAVTASMVIREIKPAIAGSARVQTFSKPLREDLREYEKQRVKEALTQAGGNLSQAARLWRESVDTFYARVRRLGLAASRAKQKKVATRKSVSTLDAPKARILLVDDDAKIRMSLARLLKQDYDVTQAQGGAEALALLSQSQEYDLVLCDLVMPQVGGMDVYRRMREVRPETAKRFVFLSGAVAPDAFRELSPGVDNLMVTKPLRLAQIEEILHKVNDKKSSN